MSTLLSVMTMLAMVWAGISGCGQQNAVELFADGQRALAEPGTRHQAGETFKQLLEQYPEHHLAPRALKKLAMLAQQDGHMEEAIALYQRLLSEYPDSGQADEAQFMIGFICEEYLGDLDQARAAYQRVIDHFPDSELAVSARRLLPNVGRDPSEWVEFQDYVDVDGAP